MTTMNHALAVAADIYNPILLILSLFIVIYQWRKGAKSYALEFFAIVALVYGWMFVDKWLGLWSYFHLDFSTHTATALAMIIFMSWASAVRFALLFITLIIYAELMVYLNYHSWADIFSTGVFVAVFVIILTYTFTLYRKKMLFFQSR